jgi:hypothetical protein
MSILDQPEYLHILLHPLPVLGLAVAVVALILAHIFKGQGAVTISLLLVALTAASAYFVYESGEGAEHRLEDTLDEESNAWLDEHHERTEVGIYMFYVTAFVAVVAMIARPIVPGFARGMTWATLALACISILAGSWIGYAGGRINHPELRDEPAALQPSTDEVSDQE